MPMKAICRIHKVMFEGAKRYGAETWRTNTTQLQHIIHALAHLNNHLAKDILEDHLAHAACRLMMALELRETTKPKEKSDDANDTKQ